MDAEMARDGRTGQRCAGQSIRRRSSRLSHQPKPYFLSYTVADNENVNISAQYGAITSSTGSRQRVADVQVRLGSPTLDNTHGSHRTSALTTLPLPLNDDRAAIARTLWYATNRGYGKALDALLKVKTEQQVRAKEEDVSADFSTEKPETELLAAAPKLEIERAAWEARLREISGVFKQYPDIYYDNVGLEASNETDYFVSSEGAKVESPSHVARLVIVARTRAADGMDLFRVETFEADALGHCRTRSRCWKRRSRWRRTLSICGRRRSRNRTAGRRFFRAARLRFSSTRCWAIVWRASSSDNT